MATSEALKRLCQNGEAKGFLNPFSLLKPSGYEIVRKTEEHDSLKSLSRSDVLGVVSTNCSGAF